MSLPDLKEQLRMLVLTQRALGLSQTELGSLVGVTRRTIIRWMRSGPIIPPVSLRPLVAAAHAEDPALGHALALAFGETLESMGVQVPPALAPAVPPAPQSPPIAPGHLADSIVCAAAEAAGLTPQAIRPALVAAFERAAAVSLSVDEVRAALAPLPGTRAKK